MTTRLLLLHCDRQPIHGICQPVAIGLQLLERGCLLNLLCCIRVSVELSPLVEHTPGPAELRRLGGHSSGR